MLLLLHICYNCGGLDHHAKECSLPPQPKKCHYCQSIMHMVANCPHKTVSQQPTSSQGRHEAEPQPTTSAFLREGGGTYGYSSPSYSQEGRSEISERSGRSPQEASSTRRARQKSEVTGYEKKAQWEDREGWEPPPAGFLCPQRGILEFENWQNLEKITPGQGHGSLHLLPNNAEYELNVLSLSDRRADTEPCLTLTKETHACITEQTDSIMPNMLTKISIQ
ncbi:Protein lin-28-like protein B isoform X1 [Aix galericulata]|nr:Protein lin-28-like protein B isoform X1 [Aix galericulata]